MIKSSLFRLALVALTLLTFAGCISIL